MGMRVRELLSDKSFRIYIIIDLVVTAILICEFIAFQYGALKLLRYIVLVEGLFVIAWIDINYRIIQNRHLLILAGIRVFILICEWLSYPLYGLSIVVSSLVGMAIGFLVFGVCYLVSKGGVGAGDVKLITVVGFYLGSTVIMPVLILTVLSSAIYSAVNLIRKKTSLKTEIPFAPFVLIGTVIAMMMGV